MFISLPPEYVLVHHLNSYYSVGIHAAAKETVALAEQRFLTNQHEWQFDNAWQEMLNHATMKVGTSLGKFLLIVHVKKFKHLIH